MCTCRDRPSALPTVPAPPVQPQGNGRRLALPRHGRTAWIDTPEGRIRTMQVPKTAGGEK